MRSITVLGETTKTFARRHAQRATVYATVLAGHALVAALLCWQVTPAPIRPTGQKIAQQGDVVSISLVEAATATTPPRQAAPKQTPKPPPKPTMPQPAAHDADGLLPPATEQTPPQLSQADTQVLADFQPAAGEPSTPCNLTEQLAAAFAHSPAVQQGLDNLPASQRSVANAVMLWDGRWPDGAASEGETLLRALLVKGVSTARPDCLQAVNTGPVLFFVPDRETMVVLAVGSGEWRWGDLLTPTQTFFSTANIGNPQPPVSLARADNR